MIKDIYEYPTTNIHEKPIAYIIIDDESLVIFPLRSGTRQDYLLLALLFNIVLEGVARESGKKHNESCQYQGEKSKINSIFITVQS